jgi:hypothetical protein
MTLKRYQTSAPPPKPLPASIRAINQPLKLLGVGVFLFIGLFLLKESVWASTPYTTGFDPPSYNLGNLNGQNGWQSESGWQIVNDKFQSTPQSAYAKKTGGGSWWAWKTLGVLFSSGLQSSYIYFMDYSVGGQATIRQGLNFVKDSENKVFTISFKIERNNSTSKWELKYYDGTANWQLLLTDVAPNEWHHLIINWEITGASLSYQYSFDESEWSEFYWANKEGSGDVDSTQIVFENDTAEAYIDTLGEAEPIPPIDCTDFLTMSTCQAHLPTCCWGWDYSAQDFTCDWCPTTECTETPDPHSDCAVCITEASCNAQADHCYWWAGSCKYGSKECGPDLKLQFCLTEGECITAGGYWYGDFCWVSPLMGLTSWSDYYDEYGGYETPSDWINNLATSVESFLGKVGGLIFSFTENFDVAEAMAQGEKLGSAIPKARAYLGIFNSFFGDFPVGEIFLFVLVLMLAVGIFRLFRNLKFW